MTAPWSPDIQRGQLISRAGIGGWQKRGATYQLRVDGALEHPLPELGRLELLPVGLRGELPRDTRGEDLIVEEVEAGTHAGFVDEERRELSAGLLVVRVAVRGRGAVAYE